MATWDEQIFTIDTNVDFLDEIADLDTEEIVDAGAHVLAIKDMAGLMRPAAAAKLVTALRERFDLPVHVHTHDTAGGQLATYLAAANAGADVVDVASAPLAGTTSQPSMSALVAAFAETERDTGIDLQSVFDMEPYWEAVRQVYAPFESGIPGPTGRVYKHEIPGGQLSNLRTQAKALGLEDRFELIEDYYAGVNEILGRPTKVTPSSKVVGDLALQLVGQGVTPQEFAENPRKYDIPESVIGFLQGELGTPPGGWPLLRDKALENRSEVDHTVKVPEELAGDLASEDHVTRRAALDKLLFPKQYAEYQEHLRTYGITDQLGDKAFFYGLEEGEETMIWYGEIDENRPPLVVSLDAVSEPDEKGMRQVILTVNGQVRPITVRDESAESTVAEVEKADSSNPGHVAAPFAGAVTVTVKEGDEVKKGDPIAEIDSRTYEATLAQAKGTLARDEAQLKGAQVDLTRYQNLATQNAVPHQTLDTQVALVAQYQGTVEADRAAVKSAEVNLAYCHIVSPINGRVGLRQVDLGNYVTPGDTNGLVVITQLEPISVLFTLPEDNLQAVKKRLKEGAVMPTAAYDRSGANKLADGSLQTFDSQIDPTTGTIKLRAQFENEGRTLYPNQFVNIRLLLDTHKDATTMSTAGIQRGVPGTFVYLVNADSTVSVRPVKLGVTDGDRVEVLSGLVPGDRIVIDGADKLREGAKVVVRSATDAANPAGTAKGTASGAANGAAKGDSKGDSKAGADPDKAGGGQHKRSEDGQTK